MKVQVNGEIKLFEKAKEPYTLSMIINELGHHPKLIVVEFNGVILNPKKWVKEIVQDGDIIEIVTIVGGGS